MTAKKPNPERGTVIVEAAFTLLLLFTFLFGLMEIGRFISVQQALTDAAREGARARITPLSQTSYLTDPFVMREHTFLTRRYAQQPGTRSRGARSFMWKCRISRSCCRCLVSFL